MPNAQPSFLQKTAQKLLFKLIKHTSPGTVYGYLKKVKLDLNSFGEDEYNTNPLTYALYYKKYDTAKTLIGFGADVNATWKGYTMLESAIATRDRKTIELLIDNGVDLHSEACKQLNPISIAVQANCMQIAWLLNGAGVDVNQPSLDGKTPLHVAAENKNDLQGKNVYFLLQMGADPSIKDSFGNTPLLCAALESCVEHARQLYDDKRTDINAANDHGNTALLIASERGAIGMVRDLLNNPAKPNPNQTNIHGHTPLSVAFSEEICDALIQAGAKINLKNAKGETPLYTAVRIGKERTVQFLLDRGADVNATDCNGMTPLFSAILGYTLAKQGLPTPKPHIYNKSFQRLINHPAIELNKTYALGATPLIFSLQVENIEMANALIDKGADVNVAHKDTLNTPIVYALFSQNLALVEKLINAGANPCVKAYDFENPLEKSEPLLKFAQHIFPESVPTLTQATIAWKQKEAGAQQNTAKIATQKQTAPLCQNQSERL